MKIIKKITTQIKDYDRIAIFTHTSIDGDSYSSSYGLALAIKEKYPTKSVKVFTDREYLKTHFPFLEAKRQLFGKRVRQKTLGIIGDTAIKERIQSFEELTKCAAVVCFDHHQNDANFAPDIYWKEPTYPASALQAVEIALELKNDFREATAIALLFGILTDTGFFRYSNNNTKAPLLYSKLLGYTTNKKMNTLFQRMNTKTPADIRMQQFIYANIVFKGKLSYVVIDQSALTKYNYNQLKMKISSIANIAGYDYWAFFMEVNEHNFKYKVSLRTATGDVNKIAKNYHGGGHIKAAGCFAKDDAEMEQLINAINHQN